MLSEGVVLHCIPKLGVDELRRSGSTSPQSARRGGAGGRNWPELGEGERNPKRAVAASQPAPHGSILPRTDPAHHLPLGYSSSSTTRLSDMEARRPSQIASKSSCRVAPESFSHSAWSPVPAATTRSAGHDSVLFVATIDIRSVTGKGGFYLGLQVPGRDLFMLSGVSRSYCFSPNPNVI